MKVFYLHGFQSSSKAIKAQILKTELSVYADIQYEALDFSDDLSLAYESLSTRIKEEINSDTVCLIGSSLGGFLALLLSIEFNIKVSLINPCLYPAKWCMDAGIVGKKLQNYDSGNEFVVSEKSIEYLRLQEMKLPSYNREKTQVFLQKGDEVLDYRYALNFFKEIEVNLDDGGSHRFDNFESKIKQIVDFFKK